MSSLDFSEYEERNRLGEMDECFLKYTTTDKSSRFHNYTRQYTEILAKYRDKPIKFLEIGISKGGSLQGWRDYFHKDSVIVGIDLHETATITDPDINIELGDATDKAVLDRLTEKYGTFDVIVDDGSHKNVDVIKSFEYLFPLLNDKGLFIVEDTSCFKPHPWVDITHDSSYPNHLQYFVQFTPLLNQWRYDSTSGPRDFCCDPFKILKKTDNVFEYSIDKVEFGCGFIAIHKLIRTHWIK